MRRISLMERSKVEVEGVEGFFEKVVTKFGTGAKIDCPRQYLGRAVYVVVRRPGARVTAEATRRPACRRPRRDSRQPRSG